MNKNNIKILNNIIKNAQNLNEDIRRYQLISVLLGIKKSYRICILPQNIKWLEDDLQKLSLYYKVSIVPNRPRYNCFISKDIKLINKLSQIDQAPPIIDVITRNSILSTGLGYADCCREKYLSHIKKMNNKSIDYIKEKLCINNYIIQGDYRINMIYVYDTRLNPSIFQKYKEVFSIRQNEVFLPHIPCSFICSDSINYVVKLEKTLKQFFPIEYKQSYEILNQDVLYIGMYEYVAFEGIFDGEYVFYSSYYIPPTFNNNELIDYLKKSNKIKLEKNNLFFFKDEMLINNYNVDYTYFNFIDTLKK